MKYIIKLLTIIILVLIVAPLLIGCTKIKDHRFHKPEPATKVYFHRGVYKTYSPNQKDSYKYYFYIFYDENSGHTEDSEMGIGLPFSCIQTENFVKFKFGGSEEPEEILKIKSVKNDVIEGAYEDGRLLIFTPVLNENPDKFDAIEYMKKNN